MLLGLDGGGTRTTAWLADERGKVLAKAVAGPSNPLKVGFEACEREILRAARAAVAAVYDRRGSSTLLASRSQSPVIGRRSSIPRLEAVVLGLAGTDRPPVHGRLSAWLRRAIPARHRLLTSDAAIAMRAAIGRSPGIIVISGTGSIAYARDDLGRVHRAGGWGTLLDDAGSGYDLGRRAMVAALRDFDGRGPHTRLLPQICAALRLKNITQVVLKSLTPSEIAALFPVVAKASGQRDSVARQLCAGAGKDLAELALALIRRLKWKDRVVPVVCGGGVFLSSPRIRRAFLRHLRNGAPQAGVMLLRAEAVAGALALARDLSQAAEPAPKKARRPARRSKAAAAKRPAR